MRVVVTSVAIVVIQSVSKLQVGCVLRRKPLRLASQRFLCEGFLIHAIGRDSNPGDLARH